MQFFKEVNQFQGAIDAQKNQRAQAAGTEYARGIAEIEKARQSQFRNKTELRLASQYFFEALSKNPQHIDAYVGIAFVLMLVGDFQQALNYLAEAQSRAPDHPQALALLAQIETIQQGRHADPEAGFQLLQI